VQITKVPDGCRLPPPSDDDVWLGGALLRAAPRQAEEEVQPGEYVPKKLNPPCVQEAEMMPINPAAHHVREKGIAYGASCETFSLKAHETPTDVSRGVIPAEIFVLRPINHQPRTAMGAAACLGRLLQLHRRLCEANKQEVLVVHMDAGALIFWAAVGTCTRAACRTSILSRCMLSFTPVPSCLTFSSLPWGGQESTSSWRLASTPTLS
jgi:hypothetical protein